VEFPRTKLSIKFMEALEVFDTMDEDYDVFEVFDEAGDYITMFMFNIALFYFNLIYFI